MTVIALLLVFLPAIIAFYAYFGYPLLLRVAAAFADDETARLDAEMPLITVVIPAYNEEAQIRGAIESQLAQDYPAELRQILILSDASNDGTDDIVREYESRGIELLRMPTRSGKTAAENASVQHIRGDVVINSDSSVRMHPRALSHLANAMRDPRVGVASTRDVSVAGHGDASNAAEAGYVGYEMRIRQLETVAGGIVGASGSGYAMRTALHRKPVRADLSRDFSAALTAHRNGYRAVSVEPAICYVPRTASLRSEYKRKVRTITRGMETLYFNRELVDPMRHGMFAWKLISHKLCRWFVPLSTPFSLIGLSMLSPEFIWARVLLVGAIFIAAVAFAGTRWPDGRRVPRWLPVGALAANLAVLNAAYRFFHGHEDHLWEPTRRPRAVTVG
jgi:cellulose synthase/poly-beta-1,6-N-acetylglucosamine synthase-like glycosyltransferase